MNRSRTFAGFSNGKNQTTRWNYDEYGRVTNKLDQTGTEILRYTYDAESRLLSRWSVAKGTTYYTNDAVGNLTFINYPASTDVTLGYDPMNRLTNMVDAAGTTTYSYTTAGRLFTEDGPWASDTVTNWYRNGLRTNLSLGQPTGVWTNELGYDAAKRLTSVTSPAGIFTYTLGGAGAASPLIKKISLPNTSYITNSFDTVARLLGTWLKNNTNGTLDSAAYAYNSGNQRTTFTNAAGTFLGYTYDPIGQLKVADSSVASEDRGYTYDAAWNLNYLTNNGALKTFKVDPLNQLTNVTGMAGAQTYDGNGNVSYGANVTYTWDDENRLVRRAWSTSSLHHPADGAQQTDFVYDGQPVSEIKPPWPARSGAAKESKTEYANNKDSLVDIAVPVRSLCRSVPGPRLLRPRRAAVDQPRSSYRTGLYDCS